jgi:phage-related tail protein
VEEAAGRAQKVSSEDLLRVCTDLESLDAMFLETLQASASGAKDAAGEILHDLAAHLRTQGSTVGAQVKETLAVFSHQLGAAGRAHAGIGLHLAKATSGLLHQIAAGALTGLADHIKPSHQKREED